MARKMLKIYLDSDLTLLESIIDFDLLTCALECYDHLLEFW